MNLLIPKKVIVHRTGVKAAFTFCEIHKNTWSIKTNLSVQKNTHISRAVVVQAFNPIAQWEAEAERAL